MKYYYRDSDSGCLFIVDKDNDVVTFPIGLGDYARGFCDGLEEAGFVKADADFFDAHMKLLIKIKEKDAAYIEYQHANEKYCDALNEFNNMKHKYNIKD